MDVCNSREIEHGQPPPPPPRDQEHQAIHLYKNTNYLVENNPYDDYEFCNRVPNVHRTNGIHLPRSSKDGPVKIYNWEQPFTLDWKKESLTLCPIPLTLQRFFDHYKEKDVKDPTIVWDTGYAPCALWLYPLGLKGTCKTKDYGDIDYVTSWNYTEFNDAEVVLMNHLFSLFVLEPPYFRQDLMPPRLSNQSWVSHFHSESLAYYPFVAFPEFMGQFDLNIGTPPHVMDVPSALWPVNDELALRFANVEPSYPFDKEPDNYIAFFVSNCAPKNNRHDLMQGLMDGIGAHSYGFCLHNKDVPEGITRNGPTWEEDKRKILASYPFALAAENSNCRGYVTEKIYDALAIGAIPVYYGAPDIADFVPEGSYINAQDFESTKELIAYMKSVDRSQFFKWKEIVKKDPSKFCKRCQIEIKDPACAIIENIRFTS
ncbi:Alpha 1,3 fucosyltransferase [Haplosporangium sp. Z 27]|nr:Alpha 1,3 fucosyltransferase [Haplosporangium sp. Z 27]